MGLLAVLNLPPVKAPRRTVPGMIDVNVPTADPAAVARAERKASRRGGKQGEVLEAALDVAQVPDAISRTAADTYALEPGNPTPVSKVAPRSKYVDIDARKDPGNDVYGKVETGLDLQPYLTSTGGLPGTDWEAQAVVGTRSIAPDSLGDGEAVSAAKGVLHKQREGEIIAMPEQQVLEHEQLHVVVAARLAHAVEEFAKAGFGRSNLSMDEVRKLHKLLLRIARNAKDHANQRLHELILPRPGRDPVGRASAETRKLLVDGTVERIVRTALLDEVRLHSRALARFRR